MYPVSKYKTCFGLSSAQQPSSRIPDPGSAAHQSSIETKIVYEVKCLVR